jgi:hypothetical protein
MLTHVGISATALTSDRGENNRDGSLPGVSAIPQHLVYSAYNRRSGRSYLLALLPKIRASFPEEG